MKLTKLAVPFTLSSMIFFRSSAEPRSNDAPAPLPIEYLQAQGLRRAVRFYQPEQLSDRPSLLIALHGSGGDGERLRRFTDGAFDRLADEHGFLVAYPDALGGQWNDCRARASYHGALKGIDDLGFLQKVIERAEARIGRDLGGTFLVGYSNGGHLAFRAALEAPQEFTAFAAIGAHLPAWKERACSASGTPVSILLVSGTEDPINPFGGGEVEAPGDAILGTVLSAEDTARYFRTLDAARKNASVTRYPDRDPGDGTEVEMRRWTWEEHEVALMVVAGGGHSLPQPTAHFPESIVGRVSRDLDGADAIWRFFHRQMSTN